MAEIFPSLNGTTYQLPLAARQALAANMQDTGTVEGAALSATYVAGVVDPGSTLGAAMRAVFGRTYRPEAFGSVGDGVADDLSAFQEIAAAINADPATPARIEITGTHFLSDGISFDGDDIECYLAAGSHVFTTAPTSAGHALGFIGYVGSGTATTPVRKRVKIHGPGKVTGWRGAAPGTSLNNENAIGVVRYAYVEIDGPQDLEAGNKAFTAQYGITTVMARNIGILRANFRGISIEDGTTDVDVRNVQAISCGSAAVVASGQRVSVKDIFGDQILTESYGTEAAVRVTGTSLAVGYVDDIRINSAGSGKGVIINGATALAMIDHVRIGSSTGNAVEPQNCTGAVYAGVIDAPNSPDKVVAVGTTPAASVKRINQPDAATITISATRFTPVSGTPVIGSAGSQLPGFLMDSTSIEAVAVLLGRDAIPASWKTFAVDVVWTNTTTNAGNVRHDASYSWLGDGDAFSTGTYVSGTAQAAPVVFGTLKVSRVVSSLTADQSKNLYLRVLRNGADATDTLVNDSGLVAVKLVRLS